jgi:hypothetical protein
MSIRTCAAMLAALSICGCASTTHSPETTTRNSDTAGGPSPCLAQTGSMIARPNCTPTGRSYSQADMARTSATSAAQALGALDAGAGVNPGR